MTVLDKIAAAVIEGDEQTTPKLINEALGAGIPSKKVLEEGLLAGMTVVGKRFREGEYFVPEVLIAAEAMKAGMAVLRPTLAQQGVKPEATAIIGTVRGDLHDIGKNLVATMLEGAGFEVVDLGVDVTAEKFVETCRQRKVDLIAMSALLTTTMPQMELAVKLIKSEIKPAPVILIGGAPVTQQYAEKIGANGYGRDAATGAEVAKKLAFKKAS